MTEETKPGSGQGQPPSPPLPAGTPGWERQRRLAHFGLGDPELEAVEFQRVRDTLTGAHSRASLHDRLRHEVERARRYGLPLSLLVVDLDHFKSVNDAFGHTRGDRVLIDFVERTRGLVRDSDLLFRYGGDEFVLLLLHTDAQQAPGFARRLIDGIQAVPFAGVPPLSVTLSVGSASFPVDGQTAEDLFERADRRLYEAKRQGRARVVAEDPASSASPFTFEVDARLLERELPLNSLRHFLDSLPDHKRGLFSINGPRRVGKTGFLAEVAKAARLRGYAVWSLHGRAAMRNRLYGAVAEAPPPVSGLPPPAASEALFIQALQRSLVEQGQAGLLVAVDRLADLDTATVDLLRQLLFTPDLSVVAVAYTTDAASPRRAALLEAPLRVQVELEALTPQGVRLWVRSVLRWEPPVSFSLWLHQETQGLPGVLSQALHYLLDRDLLQIGPDAWQLAPGF
jgi:diguanylate cyclase (GGDEF)-like protein